LLEDGPDLRLLRRLRLPRDRQVMIVNPLHQRQVERLARMVADDADDFHVQLADPHAVEQVSETMVEFGDQQQHLALQPRHAQRQIQPIDLLVFRQGRPEGLDRSRHDEGHAHEEHAGLAIVELVRLEYVAAMGGNTRCHGSDDAAAVVAAQRQNIIGHASSLSRPRLRANGRLPNAAARMYSFMTP